jgi:hypothetical protein
MPKKVLKITTHLSAIPNWLKINNSIAEIELNFATGKKTTVEIKYEPKEE